MACLLSLTCRRLTDSLHPLRTHEQGPSVFLPISLTPVRYPLPRHLSALHGSELVRGSSDGLGTSDVLQCVLDVVRNDNPRILTDEQAHGLTFRIEYRLKCSRIARHNSRDAEG